MRRKFGIFNAGFGRNSVKRKVLYYQTDPAVLQAAVEQFMLRMMGTLLTDRPDEVTIDCGGIDAVVNSLVAGTWYAVQPITPLAMEGILEGVSVDLEPASVIWDYFQRLYAEIRQARATDNKHVLLHGPMQSMTLRLQSSESGGGTVFCRFSYDS